MEVLLKLNVLKMYRFILLFENCTQKVLPKTLFQVLDLNLQKEVIGSNQIRNMNYA